MNSNTTAPHRAGFVGIIGKPNAGKSTLMNELVGEDLSIVSYKAQTTRHRIIGVVNGENYQIVYSDTPGIIKPKYALHEAMMSVVSEALTDADLILWITDIREEVNPQDELLQKLQHRQAKLLILINKIDLATPEQVAERQAQWQSLLQPVQIVPISALHKTNTASIIPTIIAHLPEHPPYYPADTLTDRPERFFTAEIIRQKIFLLYDEEIPYCSEVVIEEFKEKSDISVIRANILVERDSQKGILIGKGGGMLKKVGTKARADIEKFLGTKVFLELHVKVVPNWREQKAKLKQLGYL